MKINIHAGHNPDGQTACGAIGFLKESTEARKVKNEVIRLLKLQGHIIYDCTVDNGTSQSDVLSKIIKNCNQNTVDLDVSIHFNAGGGTGTEVYIYSGSSTAKTQAERICQTISDLGFKNRGVKVNSSLYFLKKSKSPALLIECCFVDNQSDAELYDCQKMAEAIVFGITGQVAAEKTESKQVTANQSTLYRVQVGAYSKKENALKMQENLKNKGFPAVIVSR